MSRPEETGCRKCATTFRSQTTLPAPSSNAPLPRAINPFFQWNWLGNTFLVDRVKIRKFGLKFAHVLRAVFRPHHIPPPNKLSEYW